MNIALISTGLNPIVSHLSNNPNVVLFVQTMESRKNSGLHNFVKTTLFRKFAKKKKKSFVVLDRLNFSSLSEYVQSLSVDLIIIYSMPFLVPKEFLQMKNLMIVNLHPSLLPSFKGPNPLEWAIISNEKFTGFTLHHVDEGEDTGNIISQSSFLIPLGLTKDEVRNFETLYGIPLIDKFIKDSMNRKVIEGLPQMRTASKRAKRLDTKLKYELINWHEWPIERVWHCLRFMPEIVGQISGVPKSLIFCFRVSVFYEENSCQSVGVSSPSVFFKAFRQVHLMTAFGSILLKRKMKARVALEIFWEQFRYLLT